MRIVQIAQQAEDLERAMQFYVDALGAERVATFDPPGIAFVRLGDVRVMFERGAGSARLYLEVVDETGLFGAPGTTEWQAFLRDSEGNLVGLVSRHATQA